MTATVLSNAALEEKKITGGTKGGGQATPWCSWQGVGSLKPPQTDWLAGSNPPGTRISLNRSLTEGRPVRPQSQAARSKKKAQKAADSSTGTTYIISGPVAVYVPPFH